MNPSGRLVDLDKISAHGHWPPPESRLGAIVTRKWKGNRNTSYHIDEHFIQVSTSPIVSVFLNSWALSMSSRDALHATTSQADPRKTLAVHSLSLPSLPRCSNVDHTYAGRNPAPYASDVFMEDNEAHYDNPGTSARYAQLDDVECDSHEAPKKPAMGGHFLGKLYAMLEDKTMTDYIMWRKVEGYDGFFIPDIISFVRNALPRYFPDQNQWGSFQKQLSNYGFRKKGRDTTQGLYVHWNKKFCRGRRDLLSDVMRRPKALKTQNSGQERPLAAKTPTIPPLSDQPDHVRIGHLENQLEATQNVVSEMAKQLKTLEALVQDLSDRLRAVSIGPGSPNPQVHTGPAGGAVDNHHSIHGADDSRGVDFGFMPHPPFGAHDTGASHGLPSNMATVMLCELDLSFPFQQPPDPPPSGNTSFEAPPPTLHHAAMQPTAEVPPQHGPWMQSGSENSRGPTYFDMALGLLQDAGRSAGGRSSSPNASTSTSKNLEQARARSSNSPVPFGSRRQFGGTHPVPPPAPPSPHRWSTELWSLVTSGTGT